jgi:hypothetical protein
MTILRYTNLILALIGIGIYLYLWRYVRGLVIAPLTWLINVAAFWCCRLGGHLNPEELNIWSQIIYLHGLVLLVAIGFIEIMERRK